MKQLKPECKVFAAVSIAVVIAVAVVDVVSVIVAMTPRREANDLIVAGLILIQMFSAIASRGRQRQGRFDFISSENIFD